MASEFVDLIPSANYSVECSGVCGVCGDASVSGTNQLLSCVDCGVKIHEICGGGLTDCAIGCSFRCRYCSTRGAQRNPFCTQQSINEQGICELCPNVGGALVEVADSELKLWTHQMCAIWIPEVWFQDQVNFTGVCGLQHNKVLLDRYKLTCMICKQKKVGACIQCKEKKCFAAAHVSCAMAAGMYMRYNDDAYSGVSMDFFCRDHEPSTSGHASPPSRPLSLEALGMRRGSLGRIPITFEHLRLSMTKQSKQGKVGRKRKHGQATGTPEWKFSRCNSISSTQSKSSRGRGPKKNQTRASISPVNTPFGNQIRFKDIAEVVDLTDRKYFKKLDVEGAALFLNKFRPHLSKLPVQSQFRPIPELDGVAAEEYQILPRLVFSSDQHAQTGWDKLCKAILDSYDFQVEFKTVVEQCDQLVEESEMERSQLQVIAMRQKSIFEHEQKQVGAVLWNTLSIASKTVVFVPLLDAPSGDLAAWLFAALTQALSCHGPLAAHTLVIARVKIDWVGFFQNAFPCMFLLKQTASAGQLEKTVCFSLRSFELDAVISRLRPTMTQTLALSQMGTEFYVDTEEDHHRQGGGWRQTRAFESDILDLNEWKRDNCSIGVNDDVESLRSQLTECKGMNDAMIDSLMGRVKRIIAIESAFRAECDKVSLQSVTASNTLRKENNEHVELNARCSVCSGSESKYGNLIVICDSCDKGFHQMCLSDPIDLSSKSWFCKHCLKK